MSDGTIVEEARNYLARRRHAGMRVIYRIGVSRAAAGGKVIASTRASRVAGDGSDPSSTKSAEAGRGVPEGISVRTSAVEEGDGAPGKGEKTGSVEVRGREGISIRYSDHGPAGFQGSLFDAKGPPEEPDLSRLDLVSLERMVNTCKRCGLWEGRTKTVFGGGDPAARIVFIGEAPGRDEDMQGVPFVGRAGKLLTKILASVGFTREEVYITNILKCRPPNNRDPSEDESRSCEAYLRRQLELIAPDLIVALGRVAAVNLLKSKSSLSVLRQGIHYYNDIRVLVMYHPAALLRNPNFKKGAWEDIQLVRKLHDEARAGS